MLCPLIRKVYAFENLVGSGKSMEKAEVDNFTNEEQLYYNVNI